MQESVTFPSLGLPNVMASIDFTHESGLGYSFVAGTGDVTFYFSVRQVAAPPTAVSTVPVSVGAQGTAQASGNLPAMASCSIQLSNLSISIDPILKWEILVDNKADAQNPTSDSFNNTQQLDLPSDDLILGNVRADAGTDPMVPDTNTSASASAFVDPPVIEIADLLIPGTSANYRSYFEIEFSPGYFALNGTSTRETTWGRIKKLYEKGQPPG
jgi:hypothetical protein